MSVEYFTQFYELEYSRTPHLEYDCEISSHFRALYYYSRRDFGNVLRVCNSAIELEEERKSSVSETSSTEDGSNDDSEGCHRRLVRFSRCYSVSVLYAFQVLFAKDVTFLTGLMTLIDRDMMNPENTADVKYDGFHRVLRRFGVDNLNEFHLKRNLQENCDDRDTSESDDDASNYSDRESDGGSSADDDCNFAGENSDGQGVSELGEVPTLRDCAFARVVEAMKSVKSFKPGKLFELDYNGGKLVLQYNRKASTEKYIEQARRENMERNEHSENGKTGKYEYDSSDDDDEFDDDDRKGRYACSDEDGDDTDSHGTERDEVDDDDDFHDNRVEILNKELENSPLISDYATVCPSFLVCYLRLGSLIELNYPKSDILTALMDMEQAKTDLIFEQVLLMFTKRRLLMSRAQERSGSPLMKRRK